MIEIRWVVPPNTWVPSVGWPKLQYRVHTPAIDASGALCPGPGWSDWMDVPTEVVPAPNVLADRREPIGEASSPQGGRG